MNMSAEQEPLSVRLRKAAETGCASGINCVHTDLAFEAAGQLDRLTRELFAKEVANINITNTLEVCRQDLLFETAAKADAQRGLKEAQEEIERRDAEEAEFQAAINGLPGLAALRSQLPARQPNKEEAIALLEAALARAKTAKWEDAPFGTTEHEARLYHQVRVNCLTWVLDMLGAPAPPSDQPKEGA